MDLAKRRVFVHLHIPKCGGSSVKSILELNFGPSLYDTNGVLNDYQYSSEQVCKIIYHHPNLRCLTGHKLSIALPFGHEDLDIRAFAWIRDPVDRFVSHYFYHRNHTNLVPEAKRLNIQDYVEWALVDGHQKMYVNGQTRFLAGSVDDEALEKIATLTRDGALLLFPLSAFRESLRRLASDFPSDFRYTRAATRNRSRKDQVVSPELRKLIGEYVGKDQGLLELAKRTHLGAREESDRGAPDYLWIMKRKIARVASRVLRGAARKVEETLAS